MASLKRYTLVLNFGYVESQRLGYLPWTSKQKFKDAKDALLDLTDFLKEKYLENNTVEPKKCCVSSKVKDPEAKYCSKCATPLDEQRFDGEHFSSWLTYLDTDNDTFAGIIEWDPDARWQAGELEGAPNQRFVYNAEWVLAAAAGYPPRGEITFEIICKNRTKNRKDSFSYY